MPAGLSCLTSLTLLSLHANALAEVPETIGYMTSLITLDLGQNRLKSLAGLGRLHKLLMLCAARNELEDLGDDVGGMASLCKVSVSQNKLRALPPQLLDASALKAISLHHNSFKHERDRIVRRAVPTLRELASLRVQALDSQGAGRRLLPLELQELLETARPCTKCGARYFARCGVERVSLVPSWKGHQDVPFLSLYCSFDCALATVESSKS